MTNEQRFEHLETKCKRLTLALSGMMVMAMAMLFIAAKPNADEDTIQARKLEIVDENGKVRIRLGSADAGLWLGGIRCARSVPGNLDGRPAGCGEST